MSRTALIRMSIGGAFAAALIVATAIVAPARAGALDEATIADLRAGMESGKYTARGIVEAYLRQIEAVDRSGPRINAVLEVNPDALEIADRLDAERRAGTLLGPLHGIPVLLKDNIETADAMETTAGSYALEGLPVAEDSFVAAKLRAAGAVILGKANMSVWAYFRSTRGTSGWSPRGGQTRNPYILTRSPCGSSAGSGAAVAANIVAVAIGTETDGSITCPAAANSIVGIKPTMGLVGRSGVVPGAHSQDVVGPLARTVADAAIVLGAIAGVDPRDPATARARPANTDYTQSLDANGLEGARIGVARSYFGYHEGVDALIERSIEAMRRAGAVIVEDANVETAGQFGGCEVTTFLYELKADLASYLTGRSNTGPQSLADLIAFDERNKVKEMPYFQHEFFQLSEANGGPLTDQKYIDDRADCVRLAGVEGIDATLAKHRVEAIVAPTLGPIMPIDISLGDHLMPAWATPHWAASVAAVAGTPHVSVPAGYHNGVPIGLSFMGAAWSEPTLIKLAYAFEQATKYRKPPAFHATDPVP